MHRHSPEDQENAGWVAEQRADGESALQRGTERLPLKTKSPMPQRGDRRRVVVFTNKALSKGTKTGEFSWKSEQRKDNVWRLSRFDSAVAEFMTGDCTVPGPETRSYAVFPVLLRTYYLIKQSTHLLVERWGFQKMT